MPEITHAQAGETFTDHNGAHEVLPSCGHPRASVSCITHARGFATASEQLMHFAGGTSHKVVRVCPVHGFEATRPTVPRRQEDLGEWFGT